MLSAPMLGHVRVPQSLKKIKVKISAMQSIVLGNNDYGPELKATV